MYQAEVHDTCTIDINIWGRGDKQSEVLQAQTKTLDISRSALFDRIIATSRHLFPHSTIIRPQCLPENHTSHFILHIFSSHATSNSATHKTTHSHFSNLKMLLFGGLLPFDCEIPISHGYSLALAPNSKTFPGRCFFGVLPLLSREKKIMKLNAILSSPPKRHICEPKLAKIGKVEVVPFLESSGN